MAGELRFSSGEFTPVKFCHDGGKVGRGLFLPGELQQPVQIVLQPQVAFYRPFLVRLRQTDQHHVRPAGIAFSYRVNVGSRSAGVDDDKLTEPGIIAPAVGYEPGRFQHGGGRRHDDVFNNGFSFSDAFSLDDVLHEKLTYFFIARGGVQHAYLRHDVTRIDNVFLIIMENGLDFIMGGLVAGDDDIRYFVSGRREHPGIVDDNLLVTAVRAAGQQQYIGGSSFYLFYLLPGKLIRIAGNDFRPGA